MNLTKLKQLKVFLENDLSIAPEAIALAERSGGQFPDLLPTILWQYGAISLEQLEKIWDWLDGASLPSSHPVS